MIAEQFDWREMTEDMKKLVDTHFKDVVCSYSVSIRTVQLSRTMQLQQICKNTQISLSLSLSLSLVVSAFLYVCGKVTCSYWITGLLDSQVFYYW